MPDKTPIIIYRDHLLPFSETFVLSQGESLFHFLPYYFGSRRVPGLPLPDGRFTVVNSGSLIGKAQEALHLSWRFDRPLIRQAQKIQPAFIHAHFGIDGVSALPLARALQVPLIVTFHGVDVTTKDAYARSSFYRHRRYLKYRDELKQEGAIFIAVSKFIQDCLVEAGYPAARIVQHYIGIDVTQFEPDLSVKRQPIVLFVGRLVEKKGCAYLIKAMADVQKVRADARLVVIGDGKLRQMLEAQAAATLKNYEFLGVQTPAQVRAWMNKAAVFSVPSIVADSGDSEAFGMVFAEAQCMGTPVASFCSGGIPEAVLHEETGLLAAEKDWKQLGQSILRLLENQTMWQRFSERGRERVHQLFDIRKQAAALESIYQTVC